MRRLYNILFALGFVLSAPYYFLRMRRRGNWREDFSQRFGRYTSKVKQAVSNRHVLWIHAVSVGEVNLCTQLVKALEPRLPNMKIVVSTTTTTGMGELQKKFPSHIQKMYYPVDRPKYVNRALMTLHPQVVVLVEAEIWPNFLWRAQELRIPLFLVNARLSDKSYRGYRRFGFLFRPLFAAFTGVGCQNEGDAARLRTLGCRPEAIHVVGNMKFDAAPLEERRVVDVPELLRQLGVPEGARLLVGGSTHAGEEAILAEVFQRLKPRFPGLFLVVAPRHFERGKEAGRDLTAHGVKFAYRSEMSVNSRYEPRSIESLLLNTTGELKYFYEHAAAIFVGKSLTAQGGQNPIEPGALGKAMVFGPNMQNFEAVARNFVASQAALQIPDAAGLEEALARILGDEAFAAELGRNAMRVVKENSGAMERTVDMIVNALQNSSIFVAGRRSRPRPR
ncbi:MAG: 3-deoxy-D-manno-octulosonic acid transferase [Verrucomicrobia bacterium]|nr:3-deoxy-D-manno-octulosonic acid transferase [Verrucomicrobiota bacterium]